jgi:hypothetical protein
MNLEIVATKKLNKHHLNTVIDYMKNNHGIYLNHGSKYIQRAIHSTNKYIVRVNGIDEFIICLDGKDMALITCYIPINNKSIYGIYALALLELKLNIPILFDLLGKSKLNYQYKLNVFGRDYFLIQRTPKIISRIHKRYKVKYI